MNAFLFAVFVLLALYGILFQVYGLWWDLAKKASAFPAAFDEPLGRLIPYSPPVITVIIPARNESANIKACVKRVAEQDYPAALMEILVMDDGSTDDTASIVRSLMLQYPQLRCVSLEPAVNNRAPKKRAIAAGIAMARGEWIVTTDADCEAGPGWLSMMMAFAAQRPVRFVAAPVKITDAQTLLAKFQALDFLTMQGITAASVQSRFSNLCNGANLAYRKDTYEAVNGFNGIDHIASGDDMLLMNKVVAKYPDAAGFLLSPAAIVSTLPAPGWKAFFRQRIRWASKATHYKSPALFLVLLLVYLVNCTCLTLFILGFIDPVLFVYFLLAWMIKFLLELGFVKKVADFFEQSYLLPWLFILQPLHMAYIVASGFLGQFGKYEWKGRKLK